MRAELAERLQGRRPELEAAAQTRIYAISDPAEVGDPEYVEGLRAAVSAAVDYGVATVEAGEERIPPPPPMLLVQARVAARAGVSLDTVLRRYFAGYALLGDFLMEEAEAAGLRGSALKRVLRVQAALFDRLLAAVSEEHAREVHRSPSSSEERRTEQVKRLLAGERLDTSHLAYDFDAHHLGVVANGPGAGQALRQLSRSVDRRLLSLPHPDGTLWAWFGGRSPVSPKQLLGQLSSIWPPEAALAISEPAQGLAGWCLSHRQAKAAFPIARRGPENLVRYADVALLASILGDDLLATSLREMYLKPLERERDGGEAARETLRAYFEAGRNGASAAAALGVSRQTINNRLRAIEEHLNDSLTARGAEVEAALRLEDLDHRPAPKCRPQAGLDSVKISDAPLVT